MSVVQSILDFLKSLLSWWFIVEPWEQAVRVRFGKNMALVGAGVHFKIPFFDVIYKQNVRRRCIEIPVSTITTLDGKSLTVHGTIGFNIVDVLKLHMTLHDPMYTVRQEIQGEIVKYVVSHSEVECQPKAIIAAVGANLHLEKYGLGETEFFLGGFVSNVPTYRLIQDSMSPICMSGEFGTQASTSSPSR